MENKVAAPERTYNVTKLLPDDINTIYEEIYCKNNLVMEDWFDEPFLNADTHYCKDDFLEILEDKKVYSYIAVERIFLKEPNTPGYYGNQRRGFVCFEKMADKILNILFLEAFNESVEIYKVLLDYISENSAKGDNRKIVLEIPDGRWKQVAGATAAGFKLEKTIYCKGKTDIYLYSKKIKQI